MIDEDSISRPIRRRSQDTTFKWLGLLSILSVAGLLYIKYGSDFSRLSIEPTIRLSSPQAPNERPELIDEPTSESSLNTLLPAARTAPEAESLPDLDHSDAAVAASIAVKLDNPVWIDWLGDDELIRKAVAIIDNASRGDIARKLIDLPAPNEVLQFGTAGSGLVLNEQDYARYDDYVNVLATVDGKTLRQLYDHFQPLLQQAYAELGNPNLQFNEALLAAFQIALSTPESDSPLMMKRDGGRFMFVDDEIENLPDIQKLLIRMGPINRARIKQKVRELQAILF